MDAGAVVTWLLYFYVEEILMEDLLKVGVITTTHGVRGEVKVFPTTDPERFLELEYLLLDAGRTGLPGV